jgi:DNA-binding GntR family transcriptional regulator
MEGEESLPTDARFSSSAARPADGLGSSAPDHPGRGRTLGADLRTQIEREIVEGALVPGQKLDEVVLAERFGVSRTPVREALRALSATGLVHIEPRVGAVVARPTVAEMMDLFEVVAELEGIAARLACERMTAADEQAILAAHDACRVAAAAGDAAGYYAVNGRFHGAIWTASGNAVLRRQIGELDKRLSPYRRFITFRPGRTETAIAEHEGIARAIAARDGERASRAMRDHVRVLADDVFALVKSLSL